MNFDAIPDLSGMSLEEMAGLDVMQRQYIKAFFEEERKLPQGAVPLLKKQELLDCPQRDPEYDLFKGKRCVVIGNGNVHSTKSLRDLTEIRIAQMIGRKTHDGQFLPCRIICKAKCDKAIEFIIEDPDSNVAQVFVFNFPFSLGAHVGDISTIFPLGAVIAIKEPTYKVPRHSSSSMTPFIHVQSPSDIVFLDDDPELYASLKPDWAWKEKIQIPSRSAEEWKAIGTKALKDKQSFRAAIAYSEGLKIDPSNHAIILNRIEVYLRLNWLNSALSEARRVLELEDLPTALRYKAIGRATRACYGLEDFDEAIKYAEAYPEDEYLRDFCSRAKKRKDEQARGEYDWLSLYKRQDEIYRPDIADFKGPVEVRESRSVQGQRVLCTTRDVKAGELLVLSKPIAAIYEDEMVGIPETLVPDARDGDLVKIHRYVLMRKLVERLWHDERLAQNLHLHFRESDSNPNLLQPAEASSKSDFASQSIRHPRNPATHIDIACIEDYCKYKAFKVNTDQPSKVSKHSYAADSMAIYDLPSFCNNSCLANAFPAFLGDAIVLRSLRAIPAGDEVLIDYSVSMEKGESNYKGTSLGCNCKLCVAIDADGMAILMERSSILKELRAGPPESEAEILIERMEESYNKIHWADVPIKSDLCNAYVALGRYVYPATNMPHAKVYRLSFEAYKKASDAGGLLVKFGTKKKKQQDSGMEFELAANPCLGMRSQMTLMIVMSELAKGMSPQKEGKSLSSQWLSAAMNFSNVFHGGGSKLFMYLNENTLKRYGHLENQKP